MNNLNDPRQWNIQPVPRDDGNKWNYALLVPMLGLAAFRWIWSRESRKETEEAKAKYSGKIKSIEKDLELKYRNLLMESRSTVAHLELELEKEQKRSLGFREAINSQIRKLLEEKRLLEREREQLKQQKQLFQLSGAAFYMNCLEKEEQWQIKAKHLLKEFEKALTERQNIYCSYVLHRSRRFVIENNLLIRAATDPIAAEMKMETGLIDIFKHDKHCADLMNTNKQQNGSLMWLYLKYWELAIELNKFKKIEKAMLSK
uniref:Coiled-coil domain-containing protein 127 n=1 Tax=Geotrypetes seraphini TaxID=260995 RepID=A0A6P8QEG5_GEOSA|nr:coiled-coil domain-containing protein 127 [Geotrypetes seraphini]